MTTGVVPVDEQMTATELAAAIGVDPATIAHWRGRGRGFPDGHTDGAVRTFHMRDVLPWLDTRAVPARFRRPDEDDHTTYGHRLRSYFADRIVEVAPRRGPENPGHAVREAKALASRGFPGLPVGAVLDAVLLLAFVWVVDENAWHRVESAAGSVGTLVSESDPVLRRCGIAPVSASVLGRLRGGRGEAVKRLVRVAGGLGLQGFEEVHRSIAEHENFTAADYRTPEAVAQLMAGCVRPIEGRLATVADLHCRHGELVAAVAGSAGPVSAEVVGQNSAAMRRVQMIMIMRGHRIAATVTETPPWVRAQTRQFNAVVINPPFNQPLGDVETTWEYGEPPQRRSNFAWLQVALAATAELGKAAVLMPVSSTATTDERESAIRQALVDAGTVHAIIRLPGDLFPASSVDVALWVLGRRPNSTEKSIVMVDATALKFKLSERGMPVLAGGEQLAAMVRAPFELIPGETRTVSVDGALGAARVTIVSVPEVRARDYLLTPHTYFNDNEFAGQRQIRRIEEAARAALTVTPGPGPMPSPFLRGDIEESGYPPGWELYKLEQLCDIKSGTSRLRRSLLAPGAEATVPVLRPSSLRPRSVALEELDRTTAAVAEDFRDYRVQADDLLVVRVGQVQVAARVEQEMRDWLFDSNLTRLRLLPDSPIDPDYLLEFLLNPRMSNRIRATASVHVAPTMSARSLAGLDVPVPPREQQRRIVAALQSREARIDALRRALAAEVELRDLLSEGLVAGVVGIEGIGGGACSAGVER